MFLRTYSGESRKNKNHYATTGIGGKLTIDLGDRKPLKELLPELSVVNVVVTAQIDQKVDLGKVGRHHAGLYNEHTYRGRVAYIKSIGMKGKVSVFSNGKLISVGTKSEKEARADILMACKVLADGGIKIPPRLKVKVQNIVATGNLGKPIKIEKLASLLPNAMYEPEQFSGVVYYAEELEGASVLVFANGKVVFSGLRDLRLLELARHTLGRLAEYS